MKANNRCCLFLLPLALSGDIRATTWDHLIDELPASGLDQPQNGLYSLKNRSDTDVVRYGWDHRWFYRSVKDFVFSRYPICTHIKPESEHVRIGPKKVVKQFSSTDSQKDPFPGQRKTCSVTSGNPFSLFSESAWKAVNESIPVSKYDDLAIVRRGRPGGWVYRSVGTKTRWSELCNPTPAYTIFPNEENTCQILDYPWAEILQESGSIQLSEGDVTDKGIVRYGNDKVWHYRSVGSFPERRVRCSNYEFGDRHADPRPGEAKRCELSMFSGMNLEPRFIQDLMPEGDSGSIENYTDDSIVLYGDGDDWAYRSVGTLPDRLDCLNGTFGDPKRGTVKSCKIYRSDHKTSTMPVIDNLHRIVLRKDVGKDDITVCIDYRGDLPTVKFKMDKKFNDDIEPVWNSKSKYFSGNSYENVIQMNIFRSNRKAGYWELRARHYYNGVPYNNDAGYVYLGLHRIRAILKAAREAMANDELNDGISFHDTSTSCQDDSPLR